MCSSVSLLFAVSQHIFFDTASFVRKVKKVPKDTGSSFLDLNEESVLLTFL